MINYFNDYELVKGYFEEDFSRLLFDYKINNLLMRTGDELNDILYEKYSTSKIARFDSYYKRRGKRDIIIYGTGSCAEQNYKALIHAGYKVIGFIEDDELYINEGEKIKFELPILSLGELIIDFMEAIVVVSDEKKGELYWKQLISVGFPMENIFKTNSKLRTEFGNIYFDLPELVEHADREGEIFLDAGAFDGVNSLDFINWCKENALTPEKIYLFEPMHNGIVISKNRLKNYPVEYFQYGLGKEETELSFELRGNNLMGSRVSAEGNMVVPIRTIDGVLAGRKVTFIKMDIEGAEAAALEGAAETIRKYRPKLAISMYHKPQDILELPKLVKSLNPEYKLYLRHYSNVKWDFVMYAI